VYVCGRAPARVRERGVWCVCVKLHLICSKSQDQTNNMNKIDHDPKLKALYSKSWLSIYCHTAPGRFNSKDQNNIQSAAWHP